MSNLYRYDECNNFRFVFNEKKKIEIKIIQLVALFLLKGQQQEE